MASSLFLVLVFFAFAAVASGATTQKDLEYLRAKSKEDGVVVMPSGLMYRVLESGKEGATQPGVHDPCECHYKGKLIDGTVFDSSYERGRPATFAPDQVIKGWTEAMQLMREGDKWELYIPSELAYGEAGAGGVIPPNAALVFQMQLMLIKG